MPHVHRVLGDTAEQRTQRSEHLSQYLDVSRAWQAWVQHAPHFRASSVHPVLLRDSAPGTDLRALRRGSDVLHRPDRMPVALPARVVRTLDQLTSGDPITNTGLIETHGASLTTSLSITIVHMGSSGPTHVSSFSG